MRIESAERVKVFTVYDAPKLDPITAFLQDVGPGCGRLVVECYGSVWSGYWGAMGDRALREFILDCHPSYIAARMLPNDRRIYQRETAYMVRVVDAFLSALRTNPEVGAGDTVVQS